MGDRLKHESMGTRFKHACQGVVLMIFALVAPLALAVPVHLTLSITEMDGPLQVDGSWTSLPGGLTFDILVDDSAVDTFAATDYGHFDTIAVRMTVPDLLIFNALVVTTLGYFEDDNVQRAGLTPVGDYAGAQAAYLSAGNDQVGDPNVIDILPNIVSDPLAPVWSSLFTVELENGTVFASPGFTRLGASSIAVAIPVPAPGIAGMLFLVIGWILLRRSWSVSCNATPEIPRTEASHL